MKKFTMTELVSTIGACLDEQEREKGMAKVDNVQMQLVADLYMEKELDEALALIPTVLAVFENGKFKGTEVIK